MDHNMDLSNVYDVTGTSLASGLEHGFFTPTSIPYVHAYPYIGGNGGLLFNWQTYLEPNTAGLATANIWGSNLGKVVSGAQFTQFLPLFFDSNRIQAFESSIPIGTSIIVGGVAGDVGFIAGGIYTALLFSNPVTIAAGAIIGGIAFGLGGGYIGGYFGRLITPFISNTFQSIVYGIADATVSAPDNGLSYFQDFQDLDLPGPITKFPPFPPDDGNGGGGGTVGGGVSSGGGGGIWSGGANVGGVLFNIGATLSDIHNIYGAYWDEEKQQIVMVGLVGSKSDKRHEIAIPYLNKDHLYVAMRSTLAGQPLGVSIDPPKEYRDDRNRNKHMSDGIPLLVSYLGNTQGTEFGSIMFEADRLMKSLGVGVDNETRQSITAHMPGFKTHLEMLEPGKQIESNWYRFWFVTDRVELKRNSSGDAIIFGDVKIKVLTETQYQSGEKAEISEQTAEQFARHLTEHYDEYAKEFPVLERLKELAKIAALAKYICNNIRSVDIRNLLEYSPKKYNLIFVLDNKFGADLNQNKVTRKLIKIFDENKHRLSNDAKVEHIGNDTWEINDTRDTYIAKKDSQYLNVYKKIHTPETTPGFTTWGKSVQSGNTVHTVGLFGGVDLAIDYEIITDDYTTNNLKIDAEKNRPFETVMRWDFQDSNKKEKRAVGIRIGKLSDGYKTSRCDLRLSQTNGIPIEIKRTYNSLNFNMGEFGIGWQLFIPYRLMIIPKSGKREEVLTTFERGSDTSSPPIFLINGCTGDCQHYQSVKSKENFGTYYPVTECEITKKGASFKYMPTDPIRKFVDFYEFKTNGFVYHFDLQGHLTSIFNTGHKCISYEYDGNFISNVYGADGEKIHFVRNQNGRIKQIKSSNGTIIEYCYDANGNLISAKDNHSNDSHNGSRYSYDSNGLLVEEKDLNDNILLRNSYDNLGRIINEREIDVNIGNDRIKKNYNKKNWLEMERDNSGNAVLYEYDRKGNLSQVVISDKSGAKMMLAYNFTNQLTKIENEFGEFINIQYGKDGNITHTHDSHGNMSEIIHDKENIIIKILDVKGNVWTENINTVTNQKVITDPIGESTIIDFNTSGIETVTRSDEKIKRIPIKNGSIIEYYHKNRKQSRIELNKLNNLENIVGIDNDKNCLKFDYNNIGLIQSIKDNYGEVCRFDYEKEGNDEIIVTANFQCFSKGKSEELYKSRQGTDKIKKIKTDKEKKIKTDKEKICLHCDNLNPFDARFCVYCSKPFIKDSICTNCGNEIDVDWRLCPICGKTVDNNVKKNYYEK